MKVMHFEGQCWITHEGLVALRDGHAALIRENDLLRAQVAALRAELETYIRKEAEDEVSRNRAAARDAIRGGLGS